MTLDADLLGELEQLLVGLVVLGEAVHAVPGELDAGFLEEL